MGLVRGGKLIKHDWDIDFISLGECNESLEKNVSKFLDAGFTEFKKKQDIPKWKKEDGTMSEEKYVRTYSFKKYGCRVDIDPAYISADKKSRIILKGRKRQMFCAKHPAEWFHYPTTVECRGETYAIPNPPEEYLKIGRAHV